MGALEPLTEVRVAYFEKERRELVGLNYAETVRSPLLLAAPSRQGIEPAAEPLQYVAYFAELLDEWAQDADADERLFRLGVSMVDAQSADERAVRAVAQAYFDGRARRDTVLLGSAFLLPQATMYAWRDTTLLELPIPQWLVRIANAPNTPRDPADRDEIVSIDIDHTVAHAKVRTTRRPTSSPTT